MTTKWLGVLTVLLVVLQTLLLLPQATEAAQCQQVQWRDEAGPNPFDSRQGTVVLVAMLKGYCHYCIGQAAKLEELKNELHEDGFPDIDMLIVNGGEPRSRTLAHNLISATNLTVLQDTPQHDLYRHVFRAFKDDFLVYDRCHQSAIYIPHPYSDLRHPIVARVLKSVHEGQHSCYCSQDYYEPPAELVRGEPMIDENGDNDGDSNSNSNDDRMVGDDPHAVFSISQSHGGAGSVSSFGRIGRGWGGQGDVQGWKRSGLSHRRRGQSGQRYRGGRRFGRRFGHRFGRRFGRTRNGNRRMNMRRGNFGGSVGSPGFERRRMHGVGRSWFPTQHWRFNPEDGEDDIDMWENDNEGPPSFSGISV